MKSIIDIFRRKKRSESMPEPLDPKYIPTTEEVIAIQVKETLHTFTEPFPLPRRERDIWILFGEGIGLSHSTRLKVRCVFSYAGYFLRLYDEVFHDLSKEKLSFNLPGWECTEEMLSKERFNQAVCEGLGIELKKGEILFIRYVGEGKFAVYNPAAANAKDFIIRTYAYGDYLPDILGENRVLFSKMKRSVDHEDNDSDLLFRDGDDLNLSVDSDIRFSFVGENKEKGDELCRAGVAQEEMEEFTDASRYNELPPDDDEGYETLYKLIMSGYSIEVIDLMLNRYAKQYKLYITDRLKIRLDNKDGREIKMRQLSKVLFLFLLWHNQEFFPYQLEECEDKLLSIYEKIARNDDIEVMKASIHRLVTVNSAFIDARHGVKAAFEGVVAPRSVQFYTIQGEQNCAKRINLDRSLVTWEKPLF